MTPDSNLTDSLDCATARCDDCAPTMRWERRDVSATAEAWLGTCDLCGAMQVLALGASDEEIEDPLAFFLLGVPKFEPAAARPAWQRFYARTLDAPFNLRWSFEVDPCEACQARSTVTMTGFNPKGRCTLSLCLNCGLAGVDTTITVVSAPPIRLTGSRWIPPDPAVKTLRESIFGPYRKWNALQDWNMRTAEED